MNPAGTAPVEWMVTPGLVAYEPACALMSERVDAIAAGKAAELVWLLEHPPLYTAGTSAKIADLIEPDRFPVHKTGRGGEFTYHGPGQRVGYLMLDVRRRWGGVREFVTAIEELIIDTAGLLGVRAHVRKGFVGVWAGEADRAGERQEKIAAIGVRLRHWVSSHGFSINVSPDLSHFAGIVPCGIREDGVTSLAALGAGVSMADVDQALRTVFEQRIALTREVPRAAARGMPPGLTEDGEPVGA
ncbi:MAG TPA: lipoyl(octanoyl) transferase LipB [Hyphomicrobiaceae bacterium]|nr:lipoyl(octanoyl) transferase LipB [Hyphomicrobiaceae bacterium]